MNELEDKYSLGSLKPIELHIKISGNFHLKDIENFQKIDEHMHENGYIPDLIVKNRWMYHKKDNKKDIFVLEETEISEHFSYIVEEDNDFYIKESILTEKIDSFKEDVNILLDYLKCEPIQRIGVAVRYFLEMSKISQTNKDKLRKVWDLICKRVQTKFLNIDLLNETPTQVIAKIEYEIPSEEKSKSTKHILFEDSAISVIPDVQVKNLSQRLGLSILWDSYEIRQDSSVKLEHLKSVIPDSIDMLIKNGEKYFNTFKKKGSI